MQLMMYIGNDFIEAVPLNSMLISEPGYLGKHKRLLKQKYNQLLQESTEPAEFLVINPVPITRNQSTSSSVLQSASNNTMSSAS